MADTHDDDPVDAEEGDDSASMWLNAMFCVNPTDKFAADVGRSVIYKLVTEGKHRDDENLSWRRITLEVRAS